MSHRSAVPQFVLAANLASVLLQALLKEPPLEVTAVIGRIPDQHFDERNRSLAGAAALRPLRIEVLRETR